MGPGHAGRRRARPRCPAGPLHAGLDGQRLGAAPGQRHHDGAVARVAAGPLRRRQRAEPRRGGRARGGELPLVSRRDPGRAVLRRLPPGPAACGPNSAPTPDGRWRCIQLHARRPGRSSPASPGRGAPARLAPVVGAGLGAGSPGHGSGRASYADDPTIIDAEVVDDDDDARPARAARTPAEHSLHSAPVTSTPSSTSDLDPQFQPAALCRPARLHRDLARPPRRLGRLPGGRDFRARRGAGRPAALRSRTPSGRAGRPASGPGTIRRALRHHLAAHGPDGGAAGGPLRHDPGRRGRPA